MIRNALKLLYREGVVDGYHVDGLGTLHVKWFTKYVPIVREVRTAMRTGEELQRADVFARARCPQVDQYFDNAPIRHPYNHTLWMMFGDQKEGDECIITKMTMRHGQADVIHIIARAYKEYDLDTLHRYDAPLSCLITDKPEEWEITDYD
jgi:hypothetical protein